MTRIPAAQFKDRCLKILADVAATKTSVIVTKRGRPVAAIVPLGAKGRSGSLAGSILKDIGNPFRTGESWDADRS
ncbi:MAG TPA: type II toxin-antitoxin system Phd/YefM family antitoxin [Vicinamibacterales bacterium]|nr:type II toxin-antitoxin system Phd/YefM family antitoxin [Vicinamibacterales bacterium]